MNGKIALEEHVSTPANNRLWDDAGEAARNGKAYMDDVERRLLDVDLRLADMDRYGIAKAFLSLTTPGVQGVTDPGQAIGLAQDTNDLISADYLTRYPDRFLAFATVAIQDPEGAADELERAVQYLGMKGAFINGYSNIGDENTAVYLDEPPVRVFWERVAELGVPVYLHPREPLPGDGRRPYDGYGSLIGSAWGFAQETAIHAVRLMMSGLFDDYPDLVVILGHLGEGLPQLLPRLQHRLDKQKDGIGLGAHELPLETYFRSNFYLTTSGHFHTPALRNAIDEIGEDRVMFSVDYPYESTREAVDWLDNADITSDLKQKIGRDTAARLFGLEEDTATEMNRTAAVMRSRLKVQR